MIYREYYLFIAKPELLLSIPAALVGVVRDPELWAVKRMDRVPATAVPTLHRVKEVFVWRVLRKLTSEASSQAIDVAGVPLINLIDFDRYWEVVFFKSAKNFESAEITFG